RGDPHPRHRTRGGGETRARRRLRRRVSDDRVATRVARLHPRRSRRLYLRGRRAEVIIEEGRVLANTQIGELGALLSVHAPGIAERASAGQFVHVRPGHGWDPLLRRPYSFCRIDRRAAEIELIVKPLGPGGEWIAERRPGDAVDLLGPLGTAFVVRQKTRNLLLVAGGTGIAPMRVIAEQEATRRNVTLVFGGRGVAYLWPSDRLPA